MSFGPVPVDTDAPIESYHPEVPESLQPLPFDAKQNPSSHASHPEEPSRPDRHPQLNPHEPVFYLLSLHVS